MREEHLELNTDCLLLGSTLSNEKMIAKREPLVMERKLVGNYQMNKTFFFAIIKKSILLQLKLFEFSEQLVFHW